ncbi:MAG TPA: UDP-N-acetylglucosamine 2-epimerase (non-hydrolyzing) [Dongiaceae bacterium]|nr:UDP-N-acetylglucosamine 2-epimerase (non-hydrolyzing) [Dongiaceae bacterium]
MKIAIAVGTRPEIIKMAPVIRACIARGAPHLVLHTGQHYSYEMDGVFFEELGLPAPHANLSVGSSSAPQQIAAIVAGLEPILDRERPDVVLVEGDTNSVLATALATQKAGIAVGHVEAGLRSYDRSMPEEINRILTDHLSEHLFAPTEHSRGILRGEGIAAARIVVTGNTVVDELLRHRDAVARLGLPARFGVTPGGYAMATVHRAENTDVETRLRGIVEGLAGAGEALGVPVLVALHPRTSKRLESLGLRLDGAVRPLPPLGYLDFLGLEAQAGLVLTDSGGVQEEACTLRVPCVTLRDSTERPESVEVGANVLVGADPRAIADGARRMASRPRDWPNPFGDGRSGERIVDFLLARG